MSEVRAGLVRTAAPTCEVPADVDVADRALAGSQRGARRAGQTLPHAIPVLSPGPWGQAGAIPGLFAPELGFRSPNHLARP